MKAKKFFAGMSAAALAVSMAVPAFASGLTNPNETKFDGTAAPTTNEVNLTVPTRSKVYLNPYRVSASIGTDPTDSTFAAKTDPQYYIEEESTMDQVYSPTNIIINEGTTPLDVSVTASAEVAPTLASRLTVCNTATQFDGAANKDGFILMHLEMAELGTPTDVSRTPTGQTTAVTDKKFAAPKWTGEAMAIIQDDPETATLQDTGFTIPAAAETVKKDPLTGDIISRQIEPGCAAFRLGGKVGTAPDSTTGWQTTDLVDVTVAFTFTPAADTAG